MTNDVFCVGLTRAELQTLGVLLPVTFPIITADPDTLEHDAIMQIAGKVRCIILNPKRLSTEQLAFFLYAQDDLRTHYHPVPILLFSDTMTREQNRMVPLPEFPIPVIDLHKRIDRERSIAVKLLREASFPCWQNRKRMRANMLNDAWYLIDIETAGPDVWQDQIIAVRLACMANYEANGEKIFYIRQNEAHSKDVSGLDDITDTVQSCSISLEGMVEELMSLPCEDTPLAFTDEIYTAGFLHAAFLRCGKVFTRPYVAIDKLANIPFGYLMQRHARNIPTLTDPESADRVFQDDRLQELYALTKCTFDALRTRYAVHGPSEFDKLYAAELGEE